MSIGELVNLETEKQEGLTKYQGVISSDHAYIHKGQAFTYIYQASDISSAVIIAFTTPSVESGKFVHWRPLSGYTSNAGITVVMTEDESFTGGADVSGSIYDRNRGIDNTSEMQAFASGVTATPSGLLLQAGGSGSGGSVQSRAGGSGSGENEEIVLKTDTTYLITITPSASTDVITQLFWYEEEGYRA